MYLQELIRVIRVTKVPVVIIKHTPVFDIPDEILIDIDNTDIKDLIVQNIDIKENKLEVTVTHITYLIE